VQIPQGARCLTVPVLAKRKNYLKIRKTELKVFTDALANELWKQKIDVNTIIPGPTATTTLSQQDPKSGVTTEIILDKFTNEPPAGLPA